VSSVLNRNLILRAAAIRLERRARSRSQKEAGRGGARRFPEEGGTLMQRSDVNTDFSYVELLTGRRGAPQL